MELGGQGFQGQVGVVLLDVFEYVGEGDGGRGRVFSGVIAVGAFVAAYDACKEDVQVVDGHLV